jgi:hypothetical protein
MILNTAANSVMMEFGGILDERLLAFEDAKREFLYTRALELQKLGIADSNKTVVIDELATAARDGELTMPEGLASMMPAFVEFQYNNTTGARSQVRIVAVEDIPNYEGSRAIAFYGEPLRYRLSWNAWEQGDLYLGYDGIENPSAVGGANDLAFPPAFWTFLVKKTAFNLIDIIRLKLSFLMREEEADQMKAIASALDSKEQKLVVQTQEWSKEFARWINKDLNQQPILRRSNEELWARQNDQTRPPRFLFEA